MQTDNTANRACGGSSLRQPRFRVEGLEHTQRAQLQVPKTLKKVLVSKPWLSEIKILRAPSPKPGIIDPKTQSTQALWKLDGSELSNVVIPI